MRSTLALALELIGRPRLPTRAVLRADEARGAALSPFGLAAPMPPKMDIDVNLPPGTPIKVFFVAGEGTALLTLRFDETTVWVSWEPNPPEN